MRTQIIKVSLIVMPFFNSALALDLSSFENQCADIGFKRKTQAFGECVLELQSRETNASKSIAIAQGDGTPDHATCAKYGFKTGSVEYAQCRMQIDFARKQGQEQRRRYEDQLEAQQREERMARGAAAMGMASRMLAPPPSNMHTYNLPGGRSMTCNTVGAFTNCN
jgi:hypothetical protein